MIFKAVCDYPGYFITDTGRIFGTHYNTMRELRQQTSHNGYKWISLRHLNKNKVFRISRLVMETFNSSAGIGLHCAHIDGNKENNVPSNLVWATAKENCFHKIRHGTKAFGSNVPASKLTEADIPLILAKMKEGISLNKIASEFGVARQTIRPIRDGKGWPHVQRLP